jgi:hypothetical protein
MLVRRASTRATTFKQRFCCCCIVRHANIEDRQAWETQLVHTRGLHHHHPSANAASAQVLRWLDVGCCMTAGRGQRVNCRRLGESVMQDKNGGEARRQYSEHGRRWKCGPGRWRIGCAGRTPRKYAGFDACVERALCGRIAVGSCASDGRGRGDGGLVAGERQLPPD